MKAARNHIYERREPTSVCLGFAVSIDILPEALNTLGETLEQTGVTLVEAHKSFEKTFDGSETSDVYSRLEPDLERLAGQARDLVASPKIPDTNRSQ